MGARTELAARKGSQGPSPQPRCKAAVAVATLAAAPLVLAVAMPERTAAALGTSTSSAGTEFDWPCTMPFGFPLLATSSAASTLRTGPHAFWCSSVLREISEAISTDGLLQQGFLDAFNEIIKFTVQVFDPIHKRSAADTLHVNHHIDYAVRQEPRLLFLHTSLESALWASEGVLRASNPLHLNSKTLKTN